jgi:hypothetical protein
MEVSVLEIFRELWLQHPQPNGFFLSRIFKTRPYPLVSGAPKPALSFLLQTRHCDLQWHSAVVTSQESFYFELFLAKHIHLFLKFSVSVFIVDKLRRIINPQCDIKSSNAVNLSFINTDNSLLPYFYWLCMPGCVRWLTHNQVHVSARMFHLQVIVKHYIFSIAV